MWARKPQAPCSSIKSSTNKQTNKRKPTLAWMETVLVLSVATQLPVSLFKPQGESRPYLQIIVYICSHVAGDTGGSDSLSLALITQNTCRKTCRLCSQKLQGDYTPTETWGNTCSLETYSRPSKGQRRKWDETFWEMRRFKISHLYRGIQKATCITK